MRPSAICLKSPLANTIPWFGLDIGGTLTKFVFFEAKSLMKTGDSKSQSQQHIHLSRIQRYLTENITYAQSGHRDAHLQIDNVELEQHRGSLHFVRFQTADLRNFLTHMQEHGLSKVERTICATGGGAHKFEQDLRKAFGFKLLKLDEFDTLISGILFAELQQCKECYYLRKRGEAASIKPHSFDFSNPYPFILVNVGSGVSVLHVCGPQQYKRVSGSSLGGGTFLGLCSLLTGCTSYDEAVKLAAKGDHRKVDKLVRDIYGGNYERFDLHENLIAASFGHMYSIEKRTLASHADLARATLVTITTNIGAIAHMCATNRQVDKVAFVGNFLRINPISMEMLASSMNYWSNGAMRAIFLQHEGYFGALGCLLGSQSKESPTRALEVSDCKGEVDNDRVVPAAEGKTVKISGNSASRNLRDNKDISRK